MEVIPAIDLKEGRCVRLVQGEFSNETVYSQQPVEMARFWEQQGASRLHLVDLDGAKNGLPQNLAIIKEITAKLNIPVQLGGGIRNQETVKLYLDSGIDRVILGTAAVENPALVKQLITEYGPEKIVVGVDARNGKIAVKGWLEISQIEIKDFICQMKKLGVLTFIYTDISKDGMLIGPDVTGLKKLIDIDGINIIASGGVSSLGDLKKLVVIGIESAIVGKALYTGDITPDFTLFNEL